MHCGCDSHEPTFSSTSVVGIETHLSQTFLRNVFDLLEPLISAEASGATRRADMGLPVSEGVSGYLHTWVAVYLGLFSLGSDTLEIKKNFNFWSKNLSKRVLGFS